MLGSCNVRWLASLLGIQIELKLKGHPSNFQFFRGSACQSFTERVCGAVASVCHSLASGLSTPSVATVDSVSWEEKQAMARSKQNVKRSTGGRKICPQLATRAARKAEPEIMRAARSALREQDRCLEVVWDWTDTSQCTTPRRIPMHGNNRP